MSMVTQAELDELSKRIASLSNFIDNMSVPAIGYATALTSLGHFHAWYDYKMVESALPPSQATPAKAHIVGNYAHDGYTLGYRHATERDARDQVGTFLGKITTQKSGQDKKSQ